MPDPTPIVSLVQLAQKMAEEKPARLPDTGLRRHDVALRQRRELLGVPPDYEGLDFTDLHLHGKAEEQQHQQRMIRWGQTYVIRYPQHAPALLVLRGGPGTGKTHWLYAAAQTLVHQTVCRVTSTGDLIKELRAGWTDRSVSERASLRIWRTVSWLGLDDLDRHALRGEPVQELFELLNHRVSHRKHTVLATNLSPKDLRDFLGLALSDRIRGSGGLLECGTESYRPHRAKQWNLDQPLTGDTDGQR